jgi:RNA polymerase sigma-32 factor
MKPRSWLAPIALLAALVATTGPASARERRGGSGNALDAYMREVRSHPLLTPEAQHSLAVQHHETRDPELAKRLVNANLRLVVSVARKYRDIHPHLLDLVQEGNIGLMQAVSRFDPRRGVKLSTFATSYIRGNILTFLSQNSRMVRIPNAAERRRAGPDLSLDQPIGSEDDTYTLLDVLPSEPAAQRDLFLRDKLHVFGRSLAEPDATYFRERWLTDGPKSNAEIAEGLGLKKAQVDKIERRVLRQARGYLYGLGISSP